MLLTASCACYQWTWTKWRKNFFGVVVWDLHGTWWGLAFIWTVCVYSTFLSLEQFSNLRQFQPWKMIPIWSDRDLISGWPFFFWWFRFCRFIVIKKSYSFDTQPHSHRLPFWDFALANLTWQCRIGCGMKMSRCFRIGSY